MIFADIHKRIIHICVASFTEAWIEIFPVLRYNTKLFVASFAEAWIDLLFSPVIMQPDLSRFLRGSVD